MEEKNLKLRDWMEPAHSTTIKLHDDLFAIYRLIRQSYQNAIDKAFDDVSRKIGFVVSTTIPVVIEVNDKGAVQSIEAGAENLKGTLFESEIVTKALGKMSGGSIKVSAGKYPLYLIWFEALKLKLKTDMIEPAHYRKPSLTVPVATASITAVKPEVMEPAHWFDSTVVIQPQEAVLISVIDEIYPELNLGTRISAIREKARAVKPEVMEPAHFRPEAVETLKANPAELLKAVKELLSKYS